MKSLIPMLLAALAISCSGAQSPTAPSSTPAPAPGLNLAGTWTGTFKSATRPNETHPIISWTVTQSGVSVSGPVVLGDGGGNGTLGGSTSATQFTTVQLNVVIQELPGCSYTGTGTLAASATSISGTLAMTFAAACVGPDLASMTANDTWTLSMAK